jgi:chaperonin GroEL
VADEVGISLESVTADMLGRCDRVVVGKDQTTIVADSENQEALLKRITQIRAEMEASENKFDKEKMTERIAALGGGIARIKVSLILN